MKKVTTKKTATKTTIKKVASKAPAKKTSTKTTVKKVVKPVEKKAVEKKTAKVKVPRKAKPADPRLREIEQERKLLAAKTKKVEAAIQAEKKALKIANSKVAKAVKGLNKHLAVIKSGITGYGKSLANSKSVKDTENSTTFLASKFHDLGKDLIAVQDLQFALHDLVHGEEDEKKEENW